MRIVAGSLKGRKLTVVKNETLRPTKDRVREAIFSSLLSIRSLEGARVIDLFAGTGALGIEALSRGAYEVTFVDAHAKTSQHIRRTLESFGVLTQAKVVHEKVERYIERHNNENGEAFDVVLADPPYSMKNESEILSTIAESSLMHAQSLLVFECSSSISIPSSMLLKSRPLCLSLLKAKTYGETAVLFFNLENAREEEKSSL